MLRRNLRLLVQFPKGHIIGVAQYNNKAMRPLRFSVLKKDGTFRFDGLPIGGYTLMISLTDNCGMDFEADERHWQSVFTVDNSNETLPMDLGEITFR